MVHLGLSCESARGNSLLLFVTPVTFPIRVENVPHGAGLDRAFRSQTEPIWLMRGQWDLQWSLDEKWGTRNVSGSLAGLLAIVNQCYHSMAENLSSKLGLSLVRNLRHVWMLNILPDAECIALSRIRVAVLWTDLRVTFSLTTTETLPRLLRRVVKCTVKSCK